jgi:aminopeptidase N
MPTIARISVSVPEPWVAVSSGRLSVDRGSGDPRYTWTQAHRSPLHPLIVGPFRTITRREGSIVGRGFFSEEHAEIGADLVRYALQVIEFYDGAIGAHDLSDFALVEAALPGRVRGLTLPGLTILSSDSADPSTPFPFRILAHEIAHNWWSIRVEFPGRTDFWLREGLPTYSGLMFLESTYGAEMMRQELRQTRQIALQAKQSQPLSGSLDVEDRASVSALGYHKAAFVLHMLRNLLGRERFLGLLQRFSSAYAGSSATTNDFRRVAEEVYGEDLGWFFAAWVDSAAIPRYQVRYEVVQNADTAKSTHRIVGTVQQHEARTEGPALLRVKLLGAPPLEQVVWLEAGATHFSIVCPAPPAELEFDPDEDLLHRGVQIERIESRRSNP